MRYARIMSAGLAIAACALLSSNVHAALIAEESFSYPVGELAGNGPGNGFGSNTWVDANLDTTEGAAPMADAGSLVFASGAYATGNKAALPVNRDYATLAIDTSPGSIAAGAGLVNTAGDIGADGTTIYISFLMQVNEVKDYIGLAGYRDGARVWFLGRHGSDAKVTGGTDGTGTLLGSFGGVTKNSQDQFVLRIDFRSDGDLITGWLRPTPGASEATQTPAFSNVNAGDFSFDAIAIWENAAGNIPAYFDEIRIGTAFEDVSSDKAVPVIPEPAAIGLLGMAAVLTARAGRRRA